MFQHLSSRVHTSIAALVCLFSILADLVFATALVAEDRIAAVADCSKSMSGQRLTAAKQGLKLAAFLLRPQTDFSVVTFAATARSSPLFPLRDAADRLKAFEHIDRLSADGDTNYLAALEAIPPETRAAIFVSDGEHRGNAEDVLNLCRTRDIPPIHAIAVSGKPDSAASQLLAQMATITEGSFSHVNESEDLVLALMQLGHRLHRLHKYEPDQLPARFSNVRGRLIAIGFQGQPEVTADAQPILADRHHATLPRGTVDVAIAHSAEGRSYELALTNASSGARLAAVFREDLPVAELTIPSSKGTVAAGETLAVGVRLLERNGEQVTASKRQTITSQISLIDQQGKLIQTKPAIPMKNGIWGNTFEIPAEPQSLSIHATTSVKTGSGHVFSQDDHRRIKSIRPAALIVDPSRLVATYRVGRRYKAVFQIRHPEEFTGASVQLAKSAPGVEILKSESESGRLSVTLQSQTAGTYRGEFVVIAQGSSPARGTIPFELTFKPAFDGPEWKPAHIIDLGRVLALTPTITSQIGIPTKDAQPCTYSVDVSDLSGRNKALKLTASARTIELSAKQAGSIVISAQIGNVPAGVYSAKLRLRSTEAEYNRTFPIRLEVAEPIAAKPIKLGKVAVGQVKNLTLELANHGPRELTRITFDVPKRLQDSAGKATDAVTLTADELARIPANGTARHLIGLAVSPFSPTRGVVTGVIHVRRNRTPSVDVPVSLMIVEPTECALFSVAPERLDLKAERGTPIRFSLVVKATTELHQAQVVSIKAAPFQDSVKQPVRVVSSFKWPKNNKIRPNDTIQIDAFVSSPDQPGTLSTELKISTPSAGVVVVPLTLNIR